jgi:DNA-binding NarL/FixJ family response regulator
MMVLKHAGLDERPPISVLVVEDDPDVQFLMKANFSLDSRFSVSHMVETAEDALESTRSAKPGVIVLDNGLAGPLTGLDAAPRLKRLAPQAKIIFFTAHADLRLSVGREPAIDAFLLKTESEKFLPLAQRLAGLGAEPGRPVTRRPSKGA